MIPPKRITRNKSFFGFQSLKDYTTTLFCFNHLTLLSISTMIGIVSSFITDYLYNSSHAIYTLLFLVGADCITGIYRAIKLKTFTSQRLPRILIVLISYIGLLSMSWHLAIDIPLLSFLPSIIFFGLTTTTLISIIENLDALGILQHSLVNKILTIFRKKINDSDDDQSKPK